MIELCRKAGLPEPQFEQRAGSFVITLWRDWLTAEVIAKLDLNDRQRQALVSIKAKGRITNQDLREKTRVVIRTASRDLEDLVAKGVLQKVGTTGRSTFYILARKLDTNRTNKT
jgi:predicted HTH transcriptional regulator